MRIERHRAKPLERLMGTVRLAKIKGETIQNYQATRLKEGISRARWAWNWNCYACAKKSEAL